MPAGGFFASADLSLFIQAIAPGGNGGFTFDLYGLGRRVTSAVVGTDYFAGPAPDPTDATLIQSGLITPGAAAGTFVSTSVAGDTALRNYLNAQYAGGAGAGQFIFLRVSPTAANPGNSPAGYNIATADNPVAANRPAISYTVGVAVPEPGSFALAGLGVLAVPAALRKRRAAKKSA